MSSPNGAASHAELPETSVRRLTRLLELQSNPETSDAWEVKGHPRPAERPPNLPGAGKFASVMLLVFPWPEATQHAQVESPSAWFDAASRTPSKFGTLLTLRRRQLRHHGGQISFPGGRCEPGESAMETALRETNEEVGISEEQVTLIGALPEIYIPPSDFTVTPMLGWLPQLPALRAQDDEVERLLIPSFDRLLNSATCKMGPIQDPSGRNLWAPFFELGSHQVWGASALILADFLDRWCRIDGSHHSWET